MSSDFVRYRPEIEIFDPKLSKYMTRIIDFWDTRSVNRRQGKAAGGPPSVAPTRRQSASSGQKSRSWAMRRRPYAQGIYAKPGRHHPLIRFSSASNHLGPDAALGPVLGFAWERRECDPLTAATTWCGQLFGRRDRSPKPREALRRIGLTQPCTD